MFALSRASALTSASSAVVVGPKGGLESGEVAGVGRGVGKVAGVALRSASPARGRSASVEAVRVCRNDEHRSYADTGGEKLKQHGTFPECVCNGTDTFGRCEKRVDDYAVTQESPRGHHPYYTQGGA